jgi:hypothetical protein
MWGAAIMDAEGAAELSGQRAPAFLVDIEFHS